MPCTNKQQRGSTTECLLAFEACPTDAPAGVAVKFPFTTNEVNQEANDTTSEVIDGSRNPVRPSKGNRTVTGDITIPVDVRYFGFWLSLVLGYPTTTDGAFAEGTAIITNVAALVGETIDVNGTTLTAVAGSPAANQYEASGTIENTASNLASAIDGISGVSAVAGGEEVRVTNDVTGTAGNSTVFLASSQNGLTTSGATLLGGLDAGTYKHVFKITNVDLPTIHMQKFFNDITGDQYALYKGLKASKMSLSLGGEGEVLATISLEGISESFESSSFDGSPNTYSLNKYNHFESSLKEDDVVFGNATEFTIEHDNDLTTDLFVIGGNGFRASTPEGKAAITGQMSALFTDMVLLEKAKASQETRLSAKLTQGDNSIEFRMPEVVLGENTPGIPGPKGLLVELPYTAYYDNGVDTSAMVVTIINDIPAYNI